MVLGLKENGKKESGGGKEVQLITCAVTPIYRQWHCHTVAKTNFLTRNYQEFDV